MANRSALSSLRQTLKGGLNRLLGKHIKDDVVVSQETIDNYRRRRAFLRSERSKAWVDDFGDTVFPEFDKPETWKPEFKPGD